MGARSLRFSGLRTPLPGILGAPVTNFAPDFSSNLVLLFILKVCKVTVVSTSGPTLAPVASCAGGGSDRSVMGVGHTLAHRGGRVRHAIAAPADGHVRVSIHRMSATPQILRSTTLVHRQVAGRRLVPSATIGQISGRAAAVHLRGAVAGSNSSASNNQSRSN